jgi:hypothetical protein
MKIATIRRVVAASALVLLGATPPAHSHYLFAWTMESHDPVSAW